MYRNILVAIDGGAASWRALEHAAALADACNARLTLLTVVPRVSSRVAGAGIQPWLLQHEGEEQGRRLLEQAVDALPQGVVPTKLMRVGVASEEISAQAASGLHDLVVLGSRGRGRFAEATLGSVVGHVHFHTDAPLLIVHALPDEQ